MIVILGRHEGKRAHRIRVVRFGELLVMPAHPLKLPQVITVLSFVAQRPHRTLTWLVGNLLGGAAFGFGIQLSSSALHLGNQVVNYLPGLIGGLAWSIVLAVTVATGRRPAPHHVTGRPRLARPHRRHHA
jgi:hypothetical protein